MFVVLHQEHSQRRFTEGIEKEKKAQDRARFEHMTSGSWGVGPCSTNMQSALPQKELFAHLADSHVDGVEEIFAPDGVGDVADVTQRVV